MKICFVNSNKFWGGAEKWHVRAAAFLKERGHEIHFVAKSDTVALPLRQIGIEPKILPFSSDLDVPTIVALIKYFRAIKPDAVIFNSDRDMRVAGIAAKTAGVKIRMHRKGISGIKNKFRYKWIYRNLRTHTLCVSESVKKEIEALGWVAPETLIVTYTGVDTELFVPKGSRNFRAAIGVGEKQFLVGVLARLSSIKGLDYLLKAVPSILQKYPDVNFALVGEGRLEAELKALAGELKISDSVVFAGFQSDAPDVLRSFDLMALPSIHSEGFPNSVVEAMSCGRAVVSTKLAGIPEAITNGVTGLLVEPRDTEALADAIMRLIENRDLRNAMGEKARAEAVARFDYRNRFAEFENRLAELIKM